MWPSLSVGYWDQSLGLLGVCVVCAADTVICAQVLLADEVVCEITCPLCYVQTDPSHISHVGANSRFQNKHCSRGVVLGA